MGLLGLFIVFTPDLWVNYPIVSIRVLIILMGVTLTVSTIAAIFYSFLSIFPDKTPGAASSLVSFVHVANYEGGAEAYKLAVIDADDNDVLKDLCYQTYILSQIAERKFDRIAKSVTSLKVGALAFLILTTILFVSVTVGTGTVEKSQEGLVLEPVIEAKK